MVRDHMNGVPFNQYRVGASGRLESLHQTSRLTFRHGSLELVWRGGLAVPLFWTSLFADRSELSGPTTRISWQDAVTRLEQRRGAWRSKCSEQVFGGHAPFLAWVKELGGGEVELDLGGLEEWRVSPFLDAVGTMIAFVDGRATEPGPLLCQEDAHVGFRRRRGSYRLEALTADLHWPDEAPLFAPRAVELQRVLVGAPPFRRGPWPERRFQEDELAAMPEATLRDIQAREGQARVALRYARRSPQIDEPVIGNLDGIARLRATIQAEQQAFSEATRALVASAPSFAATYQVLDDGKVWAEMLAVNEEWARRMAAHLARHEAEVREAMRGAPF